MAFDNLSANQSSKNNLDGLFSSVVQLQQQDAVNSLTSAQPTVAHSHSFWNGAWDVSKELVRGGVDEVENHPLRVLENAAIGVGLGAAAVMLGPQVCKITGAIATAYGGYQLYKHAGAWWHDASVVANSDQYTTAQLQHARYGLQGVGAGTVDALAGVVGGAAGGIATSTLKSAWFGRGAETAAEAETAAVTSTATQASTAAESSAQAIVTESASVTMPEAASPSFMLDTGSPSALTTPVCPVDGPQVLLSDASAMENAESVNQPSDIVRQIGDRAGDIANAGGNIAQSIPSRTSRLVSSMGRQHDARKPVMPQFNLGTILQFLPS